MQEPSVWFFMKDRWSRLGGRRSPAPTTITVGVAGNDFCLLYDDAILDHFQVNTGSIKVSLDLHLGQKRPPPTSRG